MIEEQVSEFNWDDAAQLTGATEKQVKFARARVAGANATEAARRAGYVSKTPEGLRSIAAQTARSKTVLSLLALAAAGNQGVACEIVSTDQRKRIYSSMIKNGSESARVAAGRILMELESQEREVRSEYPTTMEGLAAEMLKSDDDGAGALALMATYFATAKTLIGLPLKDRIYARVNASFPGLVGQLINLLPPNHYHHADEIRSTANKFSADAMRARGDDRAGSGPEANGNGAAKPGA